MGLDRWLKRWYVNSASGNGSYVVALDRDGNYGCSCPMWKFRRQECKHIQYVKTANPEPNVTIEMARPEIRFANVLEPTLDKEQNMILCPLVPLDPSALHMEATICLFLYEHGYTWGEIKEHRHIPNQWTLTAVKGYIEEHGRAKYSKYMNER